jgi:hypothetical protein
MMKTRGRRKNLYQCHIQNHCYESYTCLQKLSIHTLCVIEVANSLSTESNIIYFNCSHLKSKSLTMQVRRSTVGPTKYQAKTSDGSALMNKCAVSNYIKQIDAVNKQIEICSKYLTYIKCCSPDVG